ncbi:hypothetical protein DSO57_1019042 [Entomophthora muscae]|uniref:Uncharacterized protein n=1 Tax=Entomophthora muscae TaxID=34485 RepID=A0ACC2SGU6_9FUNG|nr:hypothetical protein DSO57_1019042 [Entomophthora muscae]
MKEISTTLSLPEALSALDFRLANQVMPHTESWCPLAIAVNYLIRIAPIVYLAFQVLPTSPAGAQLDTSMGCDIFLQGCFLQYHGSYLGRWHTRVQGGRSGSVLSSEEIPAILDEKGIFLIKKLCELF